MAHAIGAGILAPSEAIDVCFSKHQSALLGGGGDSSSTAGPQARGYRPGADERKPLFALANYEL